MKKSYCACLFAVLVMVVSVPTTASGGSFREDLSTCKLPNDLTTFPQRDTQLADRTGGYIFKFSGATFVLNPFETEGERPESIEELFRRMREEKTGDLMYSSLNGGTLVAVSGRVSDLGQGYLHEFGERKLQRPARVWGEKEKNAAGKGTPGAIEGVAEGNCYHVETAEGRFALVRLVAKGDRSALIQWVYQPDGSRAYDMPKGETVEIQSTTRPQSPSKADLLEQAALLRATETHMENRRKFIESLIEMAQPGREPLLRTHAIRTLGEIRAKEAVPMLVSMVDFLGQGGASFTLTIDNLHPCVPALVDIGVPCTSAAIQELREPTTGPERRERCQQLLLVVLSRLYGEAAAKVILTEAITKVDTETQREKLEKALEALPHVQNW